MNNEISATSPQRILADDIIDEVARDPRIEPAIKELIAHAIAVDGQSARAICESTFECRVDGRKYDVKISLEVAGKKRVVSVLTSPQESGSSGSAL